MIKRMPQATWFVSVTLVVRPPPGPGKIQSNRFENPCGPEEGDRDFLMARIIVIKKTINKKGERS